MKLRSQTKKEEKKEETPTRRYNTRSQKIQSPLMKETYNELNGIIDFEEASREWNRNKKRLGNGMYAYKK